MFKGRGKCQQIQSLEAENPNQEPPSFYPPVQNSNTEAVGSCIAIRGRINQYFPGYDTVKRHLFLTRNEVLRLVKKIYL